MTRKSKILDGCNKFLQISVNTNLSKLGECLRRMYFLIIFLPLQCCVVTLVGLVVFHPSPSLLSPLLSVTVL